VENSKDSPQTPRPAGCGVGRDLKQLQTHGKASAAELREFLAHTRGRSPQEVLGLLAGSSLVRSIFLAAAGTILVTGTIVPWLIKGGTSADEAQVKAAAAPQKTATTVERETTPKTENVTTADAANSAPSKTDAEKAVDVMGLGETKAADPKKNPLESNLDKLLDDLE